jgi:hypothetical protein
MSMCFHHLVPSGEVFIAVDDTEYGTLWETCARAVAEACSAKIVFCSRCEQPATQLDHLWPYHNEKTLCATHMGEK